jgi:hypothetical protein
MYISGLNRMSMEFGLLKFSSANIKLSEILNSPLFINVAGIIPVNFGSTAQFSLFSQMLIHDFTSSGAA